MMPSFQEFVNSYFGWEIDLCDISDEDLMMLEADYEELRKEMQK